jgi:hypothetical protein
MRFDVPGLLAKCFVFEPESRATADELLEKLQADGTATAEYLEEELLPKRVYDEKVRY